MNQLSKEFARRARGNQPYDGFIIYKLQHKLVGGGPMPPVKRKTKAVRATSKLTHLDERGRVRMVDVGEKPVTRREAVARGAVTMAAATLEVIVGGRLAKGEALAAARIAGIMAAKRTHELIPLCHPIALSAIAVEIEPDEALPGLRVRATAKVADRTGVEMEALTAVAVACLTIYDMAKAVDRGMEVTSIHLVEKRGGRSGKWRRRT
jgi:cyclic pyranopterin phosphate synthase